MINRLSNTTIISAIVLISALLFIPFLGNVHLFDWDEINFAEAAREMLVTGDYLTVQINYQPFWEKPPLFIWLQVLSMKLFGVNAFAARFPNALGGIITLVLLYLIGKQIKNKQFGVLWALFYGGSLLPFFYFKSGIIDPWFNLFIFVGLYFGYRYFTFTSKKVLHALLAGVATGLAMLTKGPVGLLIFGLVMGIYILIKRFKVQARFIDAAWFLITLVLTGGSWFILQIFHGNLDVVIDFIVYQVHLFQKEGAGHGGFFMYHFVVLFFGVFPASIFALPALGKNQEPEPRLATFRHIMLITFWTVLILFSIVNTKIVHYSSMCYFPLAFLAAYVFDKMLDNKQFMNGKWIRSLFLVTGILLSILLIAFPLVDAMKENLIAWGWISDPFAIEQFRANISWKGLEWIVGILMLGTVLYGWYALKKQQTLKFIPVFPAFMVIYLMAVLFYVPRAEVYTQKAYIEFLQEKQQEECYVETQSMKSYAKYFYTRKMPPENEKSYDKEWLLKGDIDKPVYIITRNRKAEEFKTEYPAFELLKIENGYAFFVRNPKKP